MPVSRQTFNLNIGASAATDTGPPVSGVITQFRWVPTTGDTGGDLEMLLMTGGYGDTGAAIVVYRNNQCLGSSFTAAPRQPTHDTGGTVTSEAPIFAAGEPLRVKVTPGGAAVVGKLYVYVDG